jgi:hypothetical protein
MIFNNYNNKVYIHQPLGAAYNHTKPENKLERFAQEIIKIFEELKNAFSNLGIGGVTTPSVFNYLKTAVEGEPTDEQLQKMKADLKKMTVMYYKDYNEEAITINLENKRIKAAQERGITELHVYANQLKPYINEWKDSVKDKEITFEDFLAGKMQTDDTLAKKLIFLNVRYFNDKEREQTKVEFNKDTKQMEQIGLDFAGEKKALNNTHQPMYAFVLRPEGLYAAIKSPTKSGRIQHSSFFRSGEISSAGMMSVENGKIKSIAPHSGHYRPGNNEMKNIVLYLKNTLPPEDFKAIKIKGHWGPTPVTDWMKKQGLK